MKRSLLVLLGPLGLTLGLGCPRQTSPPPAAAPPPAEQAAPEEPAPLPPPTTEPPEPAPGPCATNGRLWDGKAEGCTYEHAGCCYATAADACAAAQCPAERCNVLESAPAQISCPPVEVP